jgi:hypothetical protein
MAILESLQLEAPSTVKHEKRVWEVQKTWLLASHILLKKVSILWEHEMQAENTFAYLA